MAYQEEAVHRAALDMNCRMQNCLVVGVSVIRIVREQIERQATAIIISLN